MPARDEPSAFGEGCDARIAGKTAKANPYESGNLRKSWQHGWQDVAYNWAKMARWPYMKLPPVCGEPITKGAKP